MLRFDALAKIAANPLIQTLSTRLSSPRGGPWLVGGAIRDLLSGDRPAGFDILAVVDVMPVASSIAKELGLSLRFVDSSFNQVQIERKDVKSAKKGDHIGIKVPEKGRPNDKVFLAK